VTQRDLHTLESAMSCEHALAVLAGSRGENHIVVSNQMSARVWPTISQHPLDLNYLSSTMGGAVPLGLGLALAQPEYEVVVISGDGSLLMSLGCLATVSASRATNLTILLLDNGMYEVTGGQQTPGHQAQVDFAALARATGFRTVAAFSQLAAWRDYLPSGFLTPGPRFFSLRVLPVVRSTPRCTTTQVDKELQRLRAIVISAP
jgi:thiamine pyrophosphate-dependent acetolactate synthase large subunit-like protein